MFYVCDSVMNKKGGSIKKSYQEKIYFYLLSWPKCVSIMDFEYICQ